MYINNEDFKITEDVIEECLEDSLDDEDQEN